MTTASATGATYRTFDELLDALPYNSASATNPPEVLLPTSTLQLEFVSDFPADSAQFFRQYGSLPRHWATNAQKLGRSWKHEEGSLPARCKPPEEAADPVFTFHEAVVVDALFLNMLSADHSMHLHGQDMYLVERGKFIHPVTGAQTTVAPFTSTAQLGNTTLQQYCASGRFEVNPNTMTELMALTPQIVAAHGPVVAALIEQWSCSMDPTTFVGTPLNTGDNLPSDIVWLAARSWTIVRMKLDNPGLWPFHCHQQMHVGNGMMVVLDVLPDRQRVPSALLKNCKCDDDDDSTVVLVVLLSSISVFFAGTLVALRQARLKAAVLEVQVKKNIGQRSSQNFMAAQQTTSPEWTDGRAAWKPDENFTHPTNQMYVPQNLGTCKL